MSSSPASTPTQSRNAALKARAEAALMPNYGSRDVCMVRGEGARVWDADDKSYLDFVSGIAVNNLGHCHPAVVKAIQDQAAKLIHTSNGVLLEPQIELAELLCRETGMTKAMFGNSGCEVTEGAIKLSRIWGREGFKESKHKIMVFTGSFHGRTYGAMSATYSPKVRKGFDPFVPGFIFAEFNNIADVDAKWEDDICCVMLETIQGEGGVRPATTEFLQGLQKRCRERKAVFICDEVQCGMGRTGKRMAYMHAGVTPDVIPIAKALGGGFPIGGLLARGEFADVLTKGRHGTTFGGNPLACATALASTRIIFDDGFLDGVWQKGMKLRQCLQDVAKEFPDLCDHVRGIGLMQGLVLKVNALEVPTLARKHGLVINATAETVLRVLPPLTVTDGELEEFALKLRATLRELPAAKG